MIPALYTIFMTLPNVLLMLCSDCGQRSYIPNYSFNAPSCLQHGTPYTCPKCNKPLGANDFGKGQAELVEPLTPF